jgi:hypothetical protein
VERPDHVALDKRPEAFDRVRVNGADDILPGSMVNGAKRGFTGTGYELPNFAARSRRQTFSIGAAPPLDGPLCRSCAGAGVAAVGFRVGACDATLAPRPLTGHRRRQILSDNRNSRYGESRARSAACVRPFVAAETTQKLEKTRFRLYRPATP